MEILNTGNIAVIENYMKTSDIDHRSLDYAHLQDRILPHILIFEKSYLMLKCPLIVNNKLFAVIRC